MIEILLTALFLGLAAYRITRFFVFDSLIGSDMGPDPDLPDPASRWAEILDAWAYDPQTHQDRNFVRGKIGDLASCPWCLGFWVSCLTFGLWTWSLPWTAASPQNWVLNAFAIAGVQGFLSSRMNA